MLSGNLGSLGSGIYGQRGLPALEWDQERKGYRFSGQNMAKILIFEPEARYRMLLRFILEGMRHTVSDTEDWDEIPALMASEPPDLIVLGVRLDESSASTDWAARQALLANVPTLLLFSGNPEMRQEYLKAWAGPLTMNVMIQPVNPYPLLAMVKNMLMAPVEWRRGQHSV